MYSEKELNTKVISGFEKYYKYTRVADITKIISNMFGVNVKLAYVVLESSNNKSSLSTTSISVDIDSIDNGNIYVEFDQNHKVLFESSEWLTTERIK